MCAGAWPASQTACVCLCVCIDYIRGRKGIFDAPACRRDATQPSTHTERRDADYIPNRQNFSLALCLNAHTGTAKRIILRVSCRAWLLSINAMAARAAQFIILLIFAHTRAERRTHDTYMHKTQTRPARLALHKINSPFHTKFRFCATYYGCALKYQAKRMGEFSDWEIILSSY